MSSSFHFWRRRVFLTIGLASGVVGAVAGVLLLSSRIPARRIFSMAPSEAVRVLIPEARAADAFSVQPERADRGGMDVTSGFEIAAQVDVAPARLTQALHLVPSVPFHLEQTAPRHFRVKFATALAPGTIYQVQVPTLVAREDGSSVQRDFSWAFQTKNDFRVLTSVPGDQSSGVPVETGIEFTFTRDDWIDATSSFRISPSISGRFEAHGRTLAFVPDHPLAYATRYEVTIAKGFGVPDSDLRLAREVVMRFETQASSTPTAKPPIRWEVKEFNEMAPGMELALPIFVSDFAAASTTAQVTGYRLSPTQGRALLEARLAVPRWAPLERQRFAEYPQAAQTQAFTFAAHLQRQTSYGPFILLVPKQAEGLYAVKISPQGGGAVWMFLQVTNTAAYVIADAQTLLVWAINPSTKRPLSALPVRAPEGSAMTDAQGLARLPTPAFLSATNTDPTAPQSFRIFEIGSGAETLFVPVTEKNQGDDYGGFGGMPSDLSRMWGYLYVDRPLYHPTDAVHFFGLAQDRVTHHGAGVLEVRLQREGQPYDQANGENKIYERTSVTSDDAGTLHGVLSWNNLAPGWYRVSVMRDGREVVAREIEVRAFTKPAYAITIQPVEERVRAGTPVRGTISVAFFDGTPLARGHFQLSARQDGNSEHTQEIVTDENGRFAFQIPTTRASCEPQIDRYCSTLGTVSIQVRPTLGEEADLTASADVGLLYSDLWLQTEAMTTGTQATLMIHARHADLYRDDLQGEVWAHRELRGQIIPRHWEAIADGTVYDVIEKVTRPRYRYEERSDPPTAFRVTTDDRGQARYVFSMQSDKRYDVALEGMDDEGRPSRFQTFVSRDWYEQPFVDEFTGAPIAYSRLAFIPAERTGEFSVGETVTVQYQHGREPIEASRTPGVLFVHTQSGIKHAVVSQSPTESFVFTEDLIPNVTLRAVTFVNGHFETVENSVWLKREARALTVDASLAEPRYAPGSPVKIHVIVKKHGTDQRAPHVPVAFGAVDQALAALAGMTPEDPLTDLYRFVPEGLVLQMFTHQEPLTSGGEGMGAGGGGADNGRAAMRRIFKDTAAFEVTETDQNGEADLLFTAPDNLTSWRVQMVALSADLEAGAKVIEVPVTKPLFVDVVVPPRLLVGDLPVLKVRAFGTALPAHTPLTFTLDAPSLGVHQSSVTGTSDAPAYIALQDWPRGHHVLTMRVTSLQGSDAMERQIDVAETHFLRDASVSIELAPGTTLPELGTSEADIIFVSRGRSMLLPQVEHLRWGEGSARLDAKIAGRLMREVWHTVFGQKMEELEQPSLASYQDPQGGLRLVPSGATDLELSAEVAATAPALVDRAALSGYVWQVADQKDASREMRVQALSGLAALHEPVLPSLQALSERTDLSWREQVAVARGLLAAGDRERARALLERWLTTAQMRDGLLWLPVSARPADIYEATAEAAALAAGLAHPRAQALNAYVESVWQEEAFPVLAQTRYVLARLATLSDQPVSATWTLDGKTESRVSLKDQPAQTVRLTAEEARHFRVTKVSGPIAIELSRRVSGRPTSVPEVSITRAYAAPHSLDQLQESDLVRVTVTSTISQAAPDGCYAIRDRLPGGWEAADSVDGERSFVMCSRGTQAFHYLARIVSRGAYTAEAPLLQHLQYSTIASVGKDEHIIVR